MNLSRLFKLAFAASFVLCSSVVFSMPKLTGEGGVECPNGCTYSCGKTICVACDNDGCVITDRF